MPGAGKAGSTIRPATAADAAAMARVHIDTWSATYAGLLPPAALAKHTYASREAMWRKDLNEPQPRSHAYVGLVGERVVGFVSGGTARSTAFGFDGEIYAVYLLPEQQGRGLGRQLLQTSLERLRDDGFASAFLWVFKDNPACRFYERSGGQWLGEAEEDYSGAMLTGVAYGWDRLAERFPR